MSSIRLYLQVDLEIARLNKLKLTLSAFCPPRKSTFGAFSSDEEEGSGEDIDFGDDSVRPYINLTSLS